MTALSLHHYLVVGAVLFALGTVGFLGRRNLILMILSAEMMLQGVAINLVAFARFHGNLQGQSFVLFLLTVAACEAAMALALILMLYKQRSSLDVNVWQDLREPGWEPYEDLEPLPEQPAPPPLPRLTVAGKEPKKRSQEKSHV